jgi:hypothetical protein
MKFEFEGVPVFGLGLGYDEDIKVWVIQLPFFLILVSKK